MKTTATNRKLRLLVTGVRDETLIPDPDFQRRLVWTNKEKNNFLDTVLNGYPFPEIYIATGEVNSETAAGTELLVDGQQRITTLYQYFTASKDLQLRKDMKPYAELSQEEKKSFLEYEVVVRDLGQMSIEDIKRVFERINATSYSLNAMEIHNSRFDGEFKKFGEEITDHPFFENHKIFSMNDVKRMRDLSYVLAFIITIMSTYFNLEDELESYLSEYNDEFDMKDDLRREIHKTFEFIEACAFDRDSRAWKKSDLFTLLVEVHRALVKNKQALDPNVVGLKLKEFFRKVDSYSGSDMTSLRGSGLDEVGEYYKATIQGTNNRSSRIKRGEILYKVLVD